MARAGGEKVLDDPKLLRRSLKKEVRAHLHLSMALYCVSHGCYLWLSLVNGVHC